MCDAIISKRCWKCKSVKLLSEFYRDSHTGDGHTSRCKVCVLTHQRQYQQTEKGKEVNRAAVARYGRTEKGKEIRQTEKGKLRLKARQAVAYVVATGKMPRARTLQCTYCDKPAKEYHHHHGYEKPFWLDVVPACFDCRRD